MLPAKLCQATYVYGALRNLAAEDGGKSSGIADALCWQRTGLGSTRLVMEGAEPTVRHDYLGFGYELRGAWRTSSLGHGVDTVCQKFTGKERDAERRLFGISPGRLSGRPRGDRERGGW